MGLGSSREAGSATGDNGSDDDFDGVDAAGS
jgi:hypothetical protein